MPSAEIISIGTELLLGEIVDTNAQHIARRLRDLGIDLFRKTTIGDNTQRIAQAIQQALERCDIIITSGGLGPTVDDPTREAVALALGVETEFHPELWEQIQARFRRFNRPPTENNRRQAYVPKGAIAFENPVGTAPIFIAELGSRSISVLPGVPREMEYLLENPIIPYLRARYHLTGTIKTRILHTAGVGESQIDDLIGDLEQLRNPTVGLAAHSGQVDVRITAKADSEAEAEALIHPLDADLHQRLGKWIYGVDAETLESIALRHLESKGWSLVAIEAGLGGELSRRLTTVQGPVLGCQILAHRPSPEELTTQLNEYRQALHADAGLGVVILPSGDRQEVHLVTITPDGHQTLFRPYGGPAENAPRWAMHHSLDILRTI